MLCVDAVLSGTKLCVCLLVAFWTNSNCFSAQLFRHSAAAAHGFAGCTQESNTRCGPDSRGEDVGPCLLSDSISRDGPHSISSSIQHMGCTRQAALERQGFYCTSLPHDELKRVFINSQHHMFGMACRTAKVTVGNQMKYSNMVKGRNHDQAFDETLEFVLAAGGPTGCSTMHASTAYPVQPCLHPLLMLHKPACIYCCFQLYNVSFSSDTSILQWKLKLKIAWGQQRRCSMGEMFYAAQPCVPALLTLQTALGLVL